MKPILLIHLTLGLLALMVCTHGHAQTHPFGKLKGNYTTTIEGRTFTFKAGTSLKGSGNSITEGTLAMRTTVTINGNRYFLRELIAFHPNGMIRSGILANNATVTINNNIYTLRDVIGFHPNGMIKKGWLSMQATTTINNNSYILMNFITFHPNGMIRRGRLYDRAFVTINNIDYTFKIDGYVAFHPNGMIKEGWLVDQTRRKNGTNYTLENFTCFDDQGRIIQGQIISPYEGYIRWYSDGTLASTPDEIDPIWTWTGERPSSD